MPAEIRSTQPGGCLYSIELAWGRLRRWYLKRFRRGYVERMRQLRHSDPAGCPNEILDPREILLQSDRLPLGHTADDPFTSASGFLCPLGLAELQLMGWPLLAITVAAAIWHWYLAIVPALLFCLIVYFFRDPPRQVPEENGLLVAPADGKIVEITNLEHDDYVGAGGADRDFLVAVQCAYQSLAVLPA